MLSAKDVEMLGLPVAREMAVLGSCFMTHLKPKSWAGHKWDHKNINNDNN